MHDLYFSNEQPVARPQSFSVEFRLIWRSTGETMRTPPTLLLISMLLSGTPTFPQAPNNSSRSDVVADPDIAALRTISSFSRSPVQVVQLSGTARAMAGSTDESGTFT